MWIWKINKSVNKFKEKCFVEKTWFELLKWKHWEKATVKLEGNIILRWRISIWKNGTIYICHNNKEAEGWIPDNLMWFKNWWILHEPLAKDDKNYLNIKLITEDNKKEL